MTSIIKEWVLLIEIPFKIRELAQQGYAHFRFDVMKNDVRRVQLKAWKEVEYPKNFPCDVCGRECNNRGALLVHKRSHERERLKIPA